MNLSNLVQGHQRPADPRELQKGQADSPSHHRAYNPYVRKSPVPSASTYSYQSPHLYRPSQLPHPPPSPPMEHHNKCSLPPISSLLAETSLAEQQNGVDSTKQRTASPQQSPEHDHDSDRATLLPSHTIRGKSRINLPPTPPLRPESAQNSAHPSPTGSSNSSGVRPSSYFGQAINNVDSTMQRQSQHSTPENRHTSSSNPSTSPLTVSSFTQSPHQNLAPAYQSPNSHHPERSPTMYYQRSVPSTFPPVTVPVPASPPTGSGDNPWQHHHYISVSAQAAFPQSQDRYICQTCTKAFSRPSSLRIHSHSHTGEKPFKCPRQGCGKAFSVRSNMKRHERGCHSTTSQESS